MIHSENKACHISELTLHHVNGLTCYMGSFFTVISPYLSQLPSPFLLNHIILIQNHHQEEERARRMGQGKEAKTRPEPQVEIQVTTNSFVNDIFFSFCFVFWLNDVVECRREGIYSFSTDQKWREKRLIAQMISKGFT